MEFYTGGLGSKWGFEDGDQLLDWWWDKVDEGLLPDEPGGRALLLEVLERLVIPAIENDVATYRIATIHNPVRASKVDGVEVDCMDPSADYGIRPDFVTVDDETLLTIALEIASR